MWLMYALATVACFCGTGLWMLNRRITLWECFIMITVGYVLTGLFHVIALNAMISDIETWSGKITHATHHPTWIERYEVAVYRNEIYTDSRGQTRTRRVFSHYETRYRTHPQYWSARAFYGNGTYETFRIKERRFIMIKKAFGGKTKAIRAHRPGYHSGDRYDHMTIKETSAIIPVTMAVRFDNRIKAAPSAFSYPDVSDDDRLFEYPKNENRFISDRVMGDAKRWMSIMLWDQMNAKVGPEHKANVIIVGFPAGSDMEIAFAQEARWIGGKKNDVVICYATSKDDPSCPTWCHVFGWTEQEIVKKKIASSFMLITEWDDEAIIAEIARIISEDYVIKDWDEFGYLTIEPPGWSYAILIIVTVLVQGLICWWALKNDMNKIERGT